jgi:hypothetical protein
VITQQWWPSGKDKFSLLKVNQSLPRTTSASAKRLSGLPMDCKARNDEIRDNVTRMRREWNHNAGRWRPFATPVVDLDLRFKPHDRLSESGAKMYQATKGMIEPL